MAGYVRVGNGFAIHSNRPGPIDPDETIKGSDEVRVIDVPVMRRTPGESRAYLEGFEAGMNRALKCARDVLTDERDLEQLVTVVGIFVDHMKRLANESQRIMPGIKPGE